jgi:hypothetical protein
MTSMKDLFNKAIGGRRKHYSSASNTDSSSSWSDSPPAQSAPKKVQPVPVLPNAAANAAANAATKAQIEQAKAWEREHRLSPPPPHVNVPPPPGPPPPPFVKQPPFKPQPVPVYKQIPQQAQGPPTRQQPPRIATPSSELESMTWGNGNSVLVTPDQVATQGNRMDYFSGDSHALIDVGEEVGTQKIDVGGEVDIKNRIKTLEVLLPMYKQDPPRVHPALGDQHVTKSKSKAKSLTGLPEMIPPKHREVTVLPTHHEVNGQLLGFGERLDDMESMIRKVPKVESVMRKELHGLNQRLDDLGESVAALPQWQNTFKEEHDTQLNELGGAVLELQETHELSPTLRKTIKEGKKLGEVMEVFNQDIQRNQQTVETHETRLNNVDNHLKEHTQGISQHQDKMLEQLQSVRRTQNWLAAGLGIIGLSGLGFLAYKTISDIVKKARSGAGKPKRPNPAATSGGAPETSQVGGGPIKRRLHAREFIRDDPVFYFESRL